VHQVGFSLHNEKEELGLNMTSISTHKVCSAQKLVEVHIQSVHQRFPTLIIIRKDRTFSF